MRILFFQKLYAKKFVGRGYFGQLHYLSTIHWIQDVNIVIQLNGNGKVMEVIALLHASITNLYVYCSNECMKQ